MFVTQKVAGSHTSEHKAELPSEIQQVISDRPQHWEFLLLQRGAVCRRRYQQHGGSHFHMRNRRNNVFPVDRQCTSGN